MKFTTAASSFLLSSSQSSESVSTRSTRELPLGGQGWLTAGTFSRPPPTVLVFTTSTSSATTGMVDVAPAGVIRGATGSDVIEIEMFMFFVNLEALLMEMLILSSSLHLQNQQMNFPKQKTRYKQQHKCWGPTRPPFGLTSEFVPSSMCPKRQPRNRRNHGFRSGDINESESLPCFRLSPCE